MQGVCPPQIQARCFSPLPRDKALGPATRSRRARGGWPPTGPGAIRDERLLGIHRGALAAFAAASGMRIYDLSQPSELEATAELMERYADTPMDYADATLVLLAEALGVRDVLTLDRRGFSTYRTRRRQAFTLVMDRAGSR